MRIIAFGDIHMALGGIERLGPDLRAVDAVILTGDLTNFGGPDEADRVLDTTRRFAREVLAVSGNLDRPEVIDFLRQRGLGLHGESRRVGVLGIFGCGGSNPPPSSPIAWSENPISRSRSTGSAWPATG